MKLTSRQCKGLFARGTQDNCPPDFLLSANNLMTKADNLIPRPGMQDLGIGYSTISHMSIYQAAPIAGVLNPKLIVHNNAAPPELFVYTSPGAPIYDSIVDQAHYHSWLNFFGRGYFTLHDTLIGAPTEPVQVYEGGAVSRNAAGIKPTSTMAGAPAAGGDLGVGTYLVDVCYVTASGFVTKRSGSPTNDDCFGGYKIDLTAIPTSGGQARQIVATKAIPLGTYTGNPEDYEFFKVPNGLLNGVTTTFTVSFFDGDLSVSVEDLENLLQTIPSGIGIGVYNGRMMVWGESANPYIVRFSNPGDPESFDELSGFILVDPAESGVVTNVVVLRGTLYLFKNNRTFYTIDNGRDPTTWEVKELDSGIGTGPYGISRVLDANGNHLNQFLVASRSGIVIFDGLVRYPELTFYIEDLWNDIDPSKFNQVQLLLNPKRKHIYFTYPSLSTGITGMVMGDYSNGMDSENIKWFPWFNVNNDAIKAILISIGSNNVTNFLLAIPGLVLNMNFDTPSGSDDAQFAIDAPFFCTLQTPPLIFSGDDEDLQTLTEIRMRQQGAIPGDITVSAKSTLDSSITTASVNMPFINAPTKIQDAWMYHSFVAVSPSVVFVIVSTNKPKISRVSVEGELYGLSEPQ